MNLATAVSLIAVIAVVFFAVRYIVKAKKRGVKCIGCPAADSCTKRKN